MSQDAGASVTAPHARPVVCLWLIGNPVSGQGRGESMIHSIEGRLVAELGSQRVRGLTSTGFFTELCATERFHAGSGSHYNESGHHHRGCEIDGESLRSAVNTMNGRSRLERTAPASTAANATAGDMAAFVIRTERPRDGVDIAEAIARLNGRERLRAGVAAATSAIASPSTSTHSAPSPIDVAGRLAASAEAWLHVVGVVGGDGSLSDAVNGLCRGTLYAYRRAVRKAIMSSVSAPAAFSSAAHPLSAVTATLPSSSKMSDESDRNSDHGGGDTNANTKQAAKLGPHLLPSLAPIPLRGPGFVHDSRCGNCARRQDKRRSFREGQLSTSMKAALSDDAVAVEVNGHGPLAPSSCASPSTQNSILWERNSETVGNDVATAAAIRSATDGPALSVSHLYYWSVLSDRTVLRHLLPGMIYAPGGTGADFAKLRLCCSSAEEAVAVFCGVVDDFFCGSSEHHHRRGHETSAVRLQSAPIPMSTATAATRRYPLSPSRFLAYEVDVGRVTFPRTGRSTFFINECSIGMSCDVVERGEYLKRNRVMTALGGRLLFASSAAISLLRMGPKQIRVARLAPTPVLPSQAQSPPAFTGTAKMTPTVDMTISGEEAMLAPHRVVAAPYLPLHLRSAAAAWLQLSTDESFLAAQSGNTTAGTSNENDDAGELAQDYYCFFDRTANSFAASTRTPSAFYRMPKHEDLVAVRAWTGEDRNSGGSMYSEENDTSTFTSTAIAGLAAPSPVHELVCSADGFRRLRAMTGSDKAADSVVIAEGTVPIFSEDPVAIRSLLDLVPAPLHPVPHKCATSMTSMNASASSAAAMTTSHVKTALRGPASWVYMASSTLAFGNGRWYGGGMHVTPHANPTDGLLSCTNWVATLLPFVSGVFSLYTGGHVRWKNTTAFDGERFVVDVGPLPDKDLRRQRATNAKHRKAVSTLPLSSSITTATDTGTATSTATPAAAHGDDAVWLDERLKMRMEADGELLEELPAVVEIGGALTFFTAGTDAQGQWAACCGTPAPGTRRAFDAAHPKANHGVWATVRDDAMKQASSPQSDFGGECAGVELAVDPHGDSVEVAVGASSHGKGSKECEGGHGDDYGEEAEDNGGSNATTHPRWLERGWQSLQQLFRGH